MENKLSQHNENQIESQRKNVISTGTIAAISTPQAAGGIGIIRISGSEALNVVSRVFVPRSGANLTASGGYKAYYGRINDGSDDIDEAVCLIFRAPKSYTGEDVVELSCHGGLFVLRKTLSAIISAGATPAEAGEFTKRAFLNGKIDLSEAEAVMGIISAHGEQAAKASLNALDGALSREIKFCASEIIAVSAQMAAWVDYPDEEIEDIRDDKLQGIFSSVKDRLSALLGRFDSGQALIQGVSTVIVGKPNVGKSTLMNLLTGFERSIVTSFAGTTRDVVEETVMLGDIPLRLADTAGLHETENPVESIGVELARKKLERAQLIFAVIDGSDELTSEDKEIISMCEGRKAIAIINKNDLPQRVDRAFVQSRIKTVIEISAASGGGADELKSAVAAILGTDEFDPSAAMLASERQRNSCRRAVSILDEALFALKSGVTLDAVNVCADACIDALLEITGEKASEAVVNEVFSKFCVGK